MVRVVSQNFSPPRSRHSSGETDRDLAERANVALSTLGRRRVEVPDYESSSDSFWDSEVDGEHCEATVSEAGDNSNDINGNEPPEKSDVQSKRKERRRERNKLSAQAYRQRRRTQNVKEQQTLLQLEAENKRLHRIVETLEKKTEQAKQYLRGCSVPMPDILQPIGEVEGACADTSDTPPDLPTHRLNMNDMCVSSSSILVANHDSPSPAHSNPTLSTLSHPTVMHEPHKHLPFVMNGNPLTISTYSTSSQSNPAASPAPTPQLIINANTLIGATFAPTTATNLPTIPFSSFLAVPLENQYSNSNLKYNPLKTCSPTSPLATDSSTQPSSGAGFTGSHDTTSVMNTVHWNVNGNPLPAKGNPAPGAVFNLVKCNNTNANMKPVHAIDVNSNNKCHENMNTMSKPSSQFNLNLNQSFITTRQGDPHNELCQATFKPPHPVQYFVTPNEQGMSVSVQ